MEDISRKASIREAAKRLNPIDDLLFRKMVEEPSFCQEILRVFLRDKNLVVEESIAQYAMTNLQGRSVVADARCVLSDGTSVLIEVQKANDDDHQRRVRYNSSVLTANITDPGTKFEQVPDVCSVFVSRFDLIGDRQALSHLNRVTEKSGRRMDNGWREVYANAAADDGSETARLMKIFTEEDAYDDDAFPETSRLKRQFKEMEEGQNIMSQTVYELIEEAREEGKREARAEARREGLKEGRKEGRRDGLKVGRIEGRKEGRRELLISLVRQGLLTLSEGARQAGMKEEDFAVHLSQN